jgi:AraC family transcriptional regulator of adaptative response/methylated-DNA-[protein]-cysteine methyltransferase
MIKEEHWQAILNRDRYYDRAIVYAVISTKIYCLPSCPSRKPKRINVLIFPNHTLAEKAGFRPCKRCLPHKNLPQQPKIKLIEQICNAIEEDIATPITLSRLAARFNLSPSYLQHTFKRLVGITLRQYVEISRLNQFKLELKQQKNVADAIYQAGYNSSSSLYDNISLKLGMTPKTYQKHGLATEIIYSIINCNLGYLLVATTDRGICAVKISDRQQNLIQTLTQEFSRATIIHNDLNCKDWLESILNLIAGKEADSDLPLDIRGTSFQQQVWQELQKIPYGETRTYREIANNLGKPKATRAIGNACGANPVAIIIPCHRVVRSDGSLGGYRWGIECKQKLLDRETPQKYSCFK